ncbi:transcriptional regulator [Ketogulonicigenium robustum]|uniref:Transcriptional regulator n=1 Tax=Ketogulonicigenium robustum TaxID=92947 RepID=A0A1W6NW27_9RHOB|nr:LysR substrate-binding domain-containing protein [Ketogulonicigenium robustum]ARO13414.1 transcriptional regulator [Ketogulonicigenium robustum]
MKRFNIRQIEAFRAVVTLGSMTNAAEQLGISQPAVSRLMLDFQEAVGFKLFRKQRGGAEPTEDARRLFEQVEKLFVGLEELNQEVHAIRSLTSGSITLVAMGPYDNGILPDMIARFRQSYPDISVRIDSQPQDRVIEWVASGRADIGVLSLPTAISTVDTYELMTRPALCAMPVDHPLAAKDVITPEDLADLSFVSFPRGTPFRFRTDSIFERAGIERQMLTEASTHEAVCNLIAAGLGVSIVSPFSPHLRRNPALAFRPFKPAIPISIGMVCDEASLSVAARALHGFILSEVAHLEQRAPA